jgi:ketosteroid isomerase-like protein
VSETDPDPDTLRRSYQALNEGDLDAALEALHADAVWHESQELPGGDEFHGREAVRGFLQDFLAEWKQFHQEIEEIVVAGDRVAVLIHLTAIGRGSGIETDTRYGHVWTMRGGKGIRVDGYRDHKAALRSLGS